MKKTFLIIAIITVLIVTMFLFFIIPNYEKINQYKFYIGQKKLIISELEKLIQKKDAWQTQIGEKESIVNRINLALPEGDDKSDIILSIRSIVGLSGVVLKEIVFLDGTTRRSLADANKRFNTGNVSLKIEGSYFAFKDFLDRLENNIRIFDARLVEFKSGDNSDIFDFDINFNVYYK